MSKENELLNKEIEDQIRKARYEPPEKEKSKRPIFYMVVLALMTFAVLYSLLRSVIGLF
ncbi:TPA: hypothetical protein ACG5KU_002202 [Streptococcus agalactiae]